MRTPLHVLVVAFLSLAIPAFGQQAPPPIDPKADAPLKQMSQVLARAKSFSFTAHAIVEQVLDNGQKVDFARNMQVSVRRPDRVVAEVTGDAEDFVFYYDGRTATVFNRKTNAYGAADAKDTIDATFDLLAQTYGMVLPLADLLFADPYKTLTANVRSGQYLGTGYVFDVKCHHLAFRQEGVDWQLWIEDNSDRPLPRKIIITYKETPAQLRYTAYLNDWNLNADLPDSKFTFTPPEGAKKVDFARPPTPPTKQP
jgi:hypothetical protein